MQNIDTKAMVEGAIFTAITALMGVMIVYIPILSIMSYIWPVPIVIIGYRNGLKTSILSTIVASIIITMFTTIANGSFLLVTLGLPGIVMGYMLYKKINVNTVVIVTALVLSITLVISIVGSIYIFSPNTVDRIAGFDGILSQFINEVKNIYKMIGSDEATVQQAVDMFYQMYEILKIAFPILIITSNIPLAYMIFKFTRLILKRLGYTIDDMTKFSELRLPKIIGLVAMLLMALVLSARYIEIYWLKMVATNINILLSFTFLVVGISVIAYYLDIIGKKYNMPIVAKVILGIFISFTFMMFLPAIGILDTALDIRKWASAFKEV